MFRVVYATIKEPDGTVFGPTWQILVGGSRLSILTGFVRQIDAEIAMQFLLSLKIDWDVHDRQKTWGQLAAIGFPNREALMNAACKRLKW